MVHDDKFKFLSVCDQRREDDRRSSVGLVYLIRMVVADDGVDTLADIAHGDEDVQYVQMIEDQIDDLDGYRRERRSKAAACRR